MNKTLKWIIGIIAALVVIGMCNRALDGPVEEKPVDAVADSIAKREERINKGFSTWNGSHLALTEFVQEAMNDPESYEHVETTYREKGPDTLFIMMSFRGKNGFGGVVKNTVTVYADLDGKMISVPQFIR
jgi:hypothetical protein